MIKIGIIGKTNTGKTTFFNSATLLSAEISTYPFTTKKPNVGTAFVRTICACRELGLKDSPKSSACIDGWRFIPIELIDLPGLIKGAWMGKGLGNQFLNVAAQADALLHVVDASGSVDAEGKITRPGMGNPIIDVYDIEEELVMWLVKVIQKNRDRALRQIEKSGSSMEEALHQVLGGLKIKVEQVKTALRLTGLDSKNLAKWSDIETKKFAWRIRELSKPTIIVANKMDLPHAEKNFERLAEEFKGTFVIPCCSEAELALRRAEQKEFIKYVPGEEVFKVLDETKLTKEQKWALTYVSERVLSKWTGTGIQFALNTAVFKLLNMNVVYPVDDAMKLSDKKGNILPDALLVPYTSTVRELAKEIHTELAKTLICAIDARTGLRLPNDYILKDRDIVKIVAGAETK